MSVQCLHYLVNHDIADASYISFEVKKKKNGVKRYRNMSCWLFYGLFGWKTSLICGKRLISSNKDSNTRPDRQLKL